MTDHKPTIEQSAILSAVQGTTSNIMIRARAGCIASGTVIRYRSGNDITTRLKPIEWFLQTNRFGKQFHIQSNVDGYADYLPAIDFIASGKKHTVRMETTFGEVIATPDHEIKTDNGWKMLEQIKPKDWILTRERIARGRVQGRVTIYSIPHHPFGRQHIIGEFGNYKRMHRARLVVEAEMNDIPFEEFIIILRYNPVKAATLSYLNPLHEVHHKDENPANDEYSNLEVLTSIEHRQHHKMHLQHTKLGMSQVISVMEAGERYTYDIMMPGPHHNFLANGHVVHNCGKTATLKMIDATEKSRPYLLVCFNKAVAMDAKAEVRSATTVKTFNSIGHGIWADYLARKLTLNKNKIRDIFKALADESSKDERSFLWSQYDIVLAGVNFARAIGYIPPHHAKANKAIAHSYAIELLLDETPKPEVQGLIDKILNISIAQAYNGIIDFNDQVYMPALFGGNYPSFPVVLIDEYQDLSPVNRSMVAKLCKHSRQIGVGDEAQAIYGFRGADAESMPTAIEQFEMQVLPLSVSFRCPTNITRNVHWHVPDIRSAASGGDITLADSRDITVGPSTAVICRYNAPLISLAMTQVMSGRHVNMSGVDIGARIIRQLSKLGPEDMTQLQTISAIDDWQAEKESLDSKTAPDMAECMKVFAFKGKTLGQAIAYATHLFASTKGEVDFMSGHRSKGLEFEHVYHLDHEKIRREGQEANIHYVIDTRPSKSLTYIK